jgi:hypothetical protein
MRKAAGQRAAAAAGERPALLVRGSAEAAAALRLAAGRPVLLLSAPGAAGVLGAGGWRALVARALDGAPGADALDALCCGCAPGHALAALRAGCRLLVLDGACPAFAAVAGAAAEAGAGRAAGPAAGARPWRGRPAPAGRRGAARGMVGCLPP